MSGPGRHEIAFAPAEIRRKFVHYFPADLVSADACRRADRSHAAAHPDDEEAYRAALLRRAGAPPAVLAEVEALRRRAVNLLPRS